MGKALGSKNLMVAFFICNPPLLGSYMAVPMVKVEQMSQVFASLSIKHDHEVLFFRILAHLACLHEPVE